MAIEAITSISALAETNALQSSGKAPEMDFSQWLNSQVTELNLQSQQASQGVEQVLSGDIENLHHVIMQIEKTQLSFEMAVQVRDRLLEGYQEIMRMQV